MRSESRTDIQYSSAHSFASVSAERRLNYHIPSRCGSEELTTTFFSRFGNRLIACSWTHWYMWNESMWTIDPTQAADSSPQYIGTIQPVSFAMLAVTAYVTNRN